MSATALPSNVSYGLSLVFNIGGLALGGIIGYGAWGVVGAFGGAIAGNIAGNIASNTLIPR